jgi:hypothetical protein
MKYLVFAVKVDAEKKSVQSNSETEARVIEADNYESAHTEGVMHVPLHLGEQLAVVVIGQ